MPEVDNWFKNIYGVDSIKSKWDLYYLCLMIGLAASRTEPLGGERTDMTDYFIAEYKKSKNLIISLFICAELKKLGVEFSDRDLAKKILNNYLDPLHQSSLSNQAFQRINEYSYGGFLLLAESQEKPTDQTTFLINYAALCKSLASNNQNWG
jgi:hypothetical protein